MARILYFGVARDIAKTDSESVELTRPTSVDALWKLLIERHAGLAAIRGVSRVAVDMQYASPDVTIADESEIAIIPPVAGG